MDEITWKLLNKTWPGNTDCLENPGCTASYDGERRSPTTLEYQTNAVRFTCSHFRVTVRVDTGERLPLSNSKLARIVLWVSYHGFECDCFRAPRRRLLGEKLGRGPATTTGGWVKRTLGYDKISPTWEERTPVGPGWRGRWEIVPLVP